jgi:hypothetical protein
MLKDKVVKLDSLSKAISAIIGEQQFMQAILKNSEKIIVDELYNKHYEFQKGYLQGLYLTQQCAVCSIVVNKKDDGIGVFWCGHLYHKNCVFKGIMLGSASTVD